MLLKTCGLLLLAEITTVFTPVLSTPTSSNAAPVKTGKNALAPSLALLRTIAQTLALDALPRPEHLRHRVVDPEALRRFRANAETKRIEIIKGKSSLKRS